jgi:hypothetical protein
MILYKNLLTGKAKEDFEKWLHKENQIKFDNFYTVYNIEFFKELPFSMQYGVIVDWFDSVGIEIHIKPIAVGYEFILKYEKKNVDWWVFEKTRNEARIKAIEKACEIYNSKQNS